MKLSAHLNRYSEKKYTELIIHPEFSMKDGYVFTSNRLLNELNALALKHHAQVEIINIDYDEKSAIPNFLLVPNSGDETVNFTFNRDLDDCFAKWHVEFMAAYMKIYFAS